MTAIIVVRVRDGVHMFTEGSSLSKNNSSPRYCRKFSPFPGVPAVVALTGEVLVRGADIASHGLDHAYVIAGFEPLFRAVGPVATFDEMYARLCQAKVCDAIQLEGFGQYVIAGMSETAGPMTLFLDVMSEEQLASARYSSRKLYVVDTPSAVWGPNLDGNVWQKPIVEVFGTRPSPQSVSPERDAMTAVSILKRMNAADPHRVGGHIDHTRVYSSSISSRVIHKWDVSPDIQLELGQTDPSQNGVWIVGDTPTRATAFSTYDSMPGAYLSVMEGTVNADTLWRCTSNKGGTLGSTALVFEEFVGVGNNLSIAGDQDLTVSPTGNATSTSSSLSVQATTDETNKREFLANFGLVSNQGNGLGTPTEDKVTVYAGIQGQSGTGAIWAGNFLTRLDAASGSYSAHGIEIDLDNLNAHRGDTDLSEPSVWGLNLSGASTFRSTGAILVSGASDQWNRGITFANDCVVKATFQDLCNADISLDIQGSHVTGLDLHSATISGYAISLGAGHAIGWDSGDVAIIHFGNQLTFSGAETSYSFESNESNGTTTARILNNSDAATVTKFTALQFSGRDTINTLKETARIEVAPANDNYVGADMRLHVRATSGEAVTEVLRLGSDLSVKALSPTGGLGYGTGAGGTVTQATSKSTGVTLNKVTGQITMNAAALAANTEVTFTLTNSAIGANDIIVFNHGLTAKYVVNAVCAAGSAAISVRNVTAGSLSEALLIKYAVIKSAAA